MVINPATTVNLSIKYTMSKLLPIPTFKALPMRTDAADVKENIDLWLSKP